jgi:hypothetical protein
MAGASGEKVMYIVWNVCSFPLLQVCWARAIAQGQSRLTVACDRAKNPCFALSLQHVTADYSTMGVYHPHTLAPLPSLLPRNPSLAGPLHHPPNPPKLTP